MTYKYVVFIRQIIADSGLKHPDISWVRTTDCKKHD